MILVRQLGAHTHLYHTHLQQAWEEININNIGQFASLTEHLDGAYIDNCLKNINEPHETQN